jgi:hypothetical protein
MPKKVIIFGFVALSALASMSLQWSPADVNFNRGEKILKQREEIKQKTILQSRINHLLQIQIQSLSIV